MSTASKESSSASDLLKNSSLYREFQAEREEILRHKWIESEKAGRDIGFEQALLFDQAQQSVILSAAKDTALRRAACE